MSDRATTYCHGTNVHLQNLLECMVLSGSKAPFASFHKNHTSHHMGGYTERAVLLNMEINGNHVFLVGPTSSGILNFLLKTSMELTK